MYICKCQENKELPLEEITIKPQMIPALRTMGSISAQEIGDCRP